MAERILNSSETNQAAGATPLAVSVHVQTLKNRADFLRAARARRAHGAAFSLQARKRGDGERADPDAIRIGFTCSKKVGNAVARNRAKRRLREIARLALPSLGQPGWDYVLIGRPGATVSAPFAEMQRDLEKALRRVHAAPAPKPAGPK